MKKPLHVQIDEVRESLQKAKPRSARRVVLQDRFEKLRTEQLRLERRQERRQA